TVLARPAAGCEPRRVDRGASGVRAPLRRAAGAEMGGARQARPGEPDRAGPLPRPRRNLALAGTLLRPAQGVPARLSAQIRRRHVGVSRVSSTTREVGETPPSCSGWGSRARAPVTARLDAEAPADRVVTTPLAPHAVP